MSAPDIPTDYTVTLDGGVTITPDPATVTLQGNAAQPLATSITGDAGKPVATLLTGDATKPITATLQGNPNQPLATTLELLNLPRLSLEDLKDLLTPQLRVHLPNYEQICLKVMGMELFSVCISGEAQVITEPYKPNRLERCEIECPDLDQRPFPKTPTHDRTAGG